MKDLQGKLEQEAGAREAVTEMQCAMVGTQAKLQAVITKAVGHLYILCHLPHVAPGTLVLEGTSTHLRALSLAIASCVVRPVIAGIARPSMPVNQ